MHFKGSREKLKQNQQDQLQRMQPLAGIEPATVQI